MVLEDEIRRKLLTGHSPQQLLQAGYRKSTIYKALATTRAQLVPVTPTAWSIRNISFTNLRFQPGQSVPIGFAFKNESPLDIYITRIGVRAEWMRGEWHSQEVKDLVKSGSQRWFNFSLPIPLDVHLGEYDLFFGLEGQYLPVTYYQPAQVQWSEPVILEIKKPRKGWRIFISHSTSDMGLVRHLETNLDNEGVDVTIAEDQLEPGVVLEQKFQRLIQESNVVLALLTESGAGSEWVIKEVNYAYQLNKPCILLKEQHVKIDSQREWVEFSRYDPPDQILQQVMASITAANAPMSSPIGAIVAVGVLAFLAGIFLGDSS